MRGYTTKEKARITAGAVASLVIVGWLVVLTTVFLSVRKKTWSLEAGRRFVASATACPTSRHGA